MKIDVIHPFKVNDKYCFYDTFIRNDGTVIAIAPYYPEWLDELKIKYENITCEISHELVSPAVIVDPHKHTVVMKYAFEKVPSDEESATFSAGEFVFSCVLKRNDDVPKFCVAATQIKNCSRYVENWILYHMHIGVEYFYIFDNNSTDVDELKAVLEKYPVTYVHWPMQYRIVRHSGISGQTCAQNIALYKYNHAFVALTDVDEYIYMNDGKNLIDVLSDVDLGARSGILMKCQWFGCGRRATYDDDFLEKLVYKKGSIQSHRQGGGPKGIVHPPNVDMYSVHRVSRGKPMVHLNEDVVRFNHYFTLTLDTYKNNRHPDRRTSKCACDVLDAVLDDSLANIWRAIKPKKFVFVSIPKNGSQSVFDMFGYKLKDHSKESDRGIMDNHARCVVLKKRYKDFDERYKFCFVRDPLERLVSWYDYHLKRYRCEPYTKMDFRSWVLADCPHHWKKQNGTSWQGDLSPLHQWQFIYDDDGNLMVDDVFRMENFEQDLHAACSKIGMKLPRSLTHKNKATKGDWLMRYDEETTQRAKELFAKDITLFGY